MPGVTAHVSRQQTPSSSSGRLCHDVFFPTSSLSVACGSDMLPWLPSQPRQMNPRPRNLTTRPERARPPGRLKHCCPGVAGVRVSRSIARLIPTRCVMPCSKRICRKGVEVSAESSPQIDIPAV